MYKDRGIIYTDVFYVMGKVSCKIHSIHPDFKRREGKAPFTSKGNIFVEVKRKEGNHV